ncbi:MAG: hypothetical protein IKC97_03090 [Clostridia bacterium]|nr:hypothetical protein [Clostridia bacterium]
MKKRVISFLLCLVMLFSACAFCLTGCSPKEDEPTDEEKEQAKNNKAATLVMWCVTENAKELNEKGELAFDDETQTQMKNVVKQMTAITQSQLKTKLIVKYLTMEEYYEKLEEALAWQQEQAKIKEEAGNKNDKEDVEEELPEEEEEEDEEIKYDEDGNPIIDTTKYPELTKEQLEYQVDILYISGYDKYTDYVAGYHNSEEDSLKSLLKKLLGEERITQEEFDEGSKKKNIYTFLNKLLEEGRVTQEEINPYTFKKWLAPLDAPLKEDGKKISNYVSGALLNAARYKNNIYAIPNNNVIGEYTYMLIDKQLFDKYYYTASVPDVHGVVDLGDFLEDIAAYEKDVMPINADVNYCMSMIAHYWDIDPATNKITGDFSILGYAYENTDRVNRGDIALKFDSLFANDTYKNALKNLMDFHYKGYFGTAAEGQKSAVSFVTGAASDAAAYKDDYYVVVVDYPLASDQDIYNNMFAVSAYSSNIKKSMQVITLLNTDEELRNLFLYGIEGTNYTRNSDGTVSATRNNKYKMDIAKTGNEFLAYVPEGTDLELWEYAKQQNREALVNPLLGFDYNAILADNTLVKNESEKLADPDDTSDEYTIESIDTDLIRYVSEKSKEVWAQIEACKDTDELEELLEKLEALYSPESDLKIKRAVSYQVVCSEFGPEGEIKTDENGMPTVPNPTIDEKCVVLYRDIIEVNDGVETVVGTEPYKVYYNKINPYQLYYRWMSTYKFLPAGFAG